jgi:hypothetical protein
MTCVNNLAHQGSCACYLGSKPTRLLRVWVCSVLRTCCFVEHHAGAATSLSACVLGQLLSCCRLAEGHADWTWLHRVAAPCNVSSVLGEYVTWTFGWTLAWHAAAHFTCVDILCSTHHQHTRQDQHSNSDATMISVCAAACSHWCWQSRLQNEV